MKKIILIGFMCLCLISCQGHRSSQQEHFVWKDLFIDNMQEKSKTVQAAVLLPLSGKTAKIGASMQKSSMMALQDRPHSSLQLFFYDTKGTPEGVEQAWEEAQINDPDIIIGPVYAEEVKALKSEHPSVPILSFTSDNSLMKSDVYTLGILLPNQVERMTQYMCTSGRRKIAVIGPENKTGELVMNSLMEQIERCPNMTVDKIALYPEDTINFNETVLKIVPKPINPKKPDLTEEEKVLLETPIEERIDFDALFIYEDGVKLQQITSLLAYYDVTPKVVPFFGLANWQQTKDRALAGAYFVGTPTGRLTAFQNRYNKTFGENPTKLATLAYDGVSLVAVLAEQQALTTANLRSDSGFNGVNGRFRLNSDGTNERLFDVFQLDNRLRPQVVEQAPTEFPEYMPMFVEEPEIEEGISDEIPTESSDENIETTTNTPIIE